MFDGSSGHKRVSLAGRASKGTAERRDVLERARREREERAAERRRAAAALRIQAHWRRARCAMRTAMAAALELDKKLADLRRVADIAAAVGAPFVLPRRELSVLLRLLLASDTWAHMHRGGRGAHEALQPPAAYVRATQVLAALHHNMQHADAAANYLALLAPAAQAPMRAMAVVQLVGVARLIARQIQRLIQPAVVGVPGAEALARKCADIMQVLVHPAAWPEAVRLQVPDTAARDVLSKLSARAALQVSGQCSLLGHRTTPLSLTPGAHAELCAAEAAVADQG